jgi:AcrR family transcriptional regulator
VSPKTRTPEDRRAAVLQAASDVFVAQGFERAKLDEIARKAKVSKSALYEVAVSKTDLFYRVFRRHLDEEIERAERVMRREDDPIVCLRKIMRAVLPTRREQPGLYSAIIKLHAMAVRDPAVGQRVRQYRLERLQRFRLPLRDKIEVGVVRGVFRQDLDSTEVAVSIAAWVSLMWLEWVVFPERRVEELQARADRHIEHLLRLICVAPPPARDPNNARD